MGIERAEATGGNDAKAMKAHKFLGSLKDALLAAGRDEQPAPVSAVVPSPAATPPALANSSTDKMPPLKDKPQSPSAEEAARLARTEPTEKAQGVVAPALLEDRDGPPTTRVVRGEAEKKPQRASVEDSDASPRTQLVRGRQPIVRSDFERDPVVGFLIVVGGPGIGSFRPIFEGNNTVGRSKENRIPIDFGDMAISSEAQAYIRYDSNDRSFLFVPNLAKTNVVSVNEKRPTGAVPLHVMDVITLGRTQVAFLPFCGTDFDWSEISQA